MVRAFQFFGCVTKKIIFDNMKIVDNHSKSSFSKTVFNQRFEYFAKDIGFEPLACRTYRHQNKGKMESLAKLMDRLKVYNEEFDTWNDFKNIIANFMDDINNETSKSSG